MNLWIIDDEINLANGLKKAFERKNFTVRTAGTIAGLDKLMSEEVPSLIFLDQRLPDGNGIDSLPVILKQAPGCKVIVMTAFGDSSLVVKAIREGAYNYLDKPFPLDAAMNMIDRACESIKLKNQADRMLSMETDELFGESPAMLKIQNNLLMIAPHSNISVLLRGESGTGKEVAARMLHRASRCSGEFVALNCSAIPEQLLEAELFGCKKGAFTGADRDKQGLIEAADKGTLFLDEIGDMPLPLQSKLFRFMDQRTFRPLGDTKEKKVDVKLICATCLDLEQKVKDGTFRKDLYYRISVIPVELPPLRERGNDVLGLTSLFLADFAKDMGKVADTVTDDVKKVFLSYSWPGNVRELRNLLERVLIMKEPCDHTIRLADLPPEMLDLPRLAGHSDTTVREHGGETLDEATGNFERSLIVSTLAKCGGNKTQTAAELGISRFSLLRRMQRYDLN